MKAFFHILLATVLIMAHLISVAPKALVKDNFCQAGLVADNDKKIAKEDPDSEKSSENEESRETEDKEAEEKNEFEKEFLLPSQTAQLLIASGYLWSWPEDGKQMTFFTEISIPPPECWNKA